MAHSGDTHLSEGVAAASTVVHAAIVVITGMCCLTVCHALQMKEVEKEVKCTWLFVSAAEVPKRDGRPGRELLITMQGNDGLIRMLWDGSYAGLNTEAMKAVYTDLHAKTATDR